MSLDKTRLFVLGAGFSAGAGIPMTNRLLLDSLALMKVECNGIYKRIQNSACICFDNDLELLSQTLDANGFAKLASFLHYIEMRNYGGGERCSTAGDRETLTLKFFLSKKIASLTPNKIPEHYIEFAKQLSCFDTIVTFNWDCLLEKAILAAGKKFTYNYEEVSWDKTDLILICKMHGSINWTLPHGRKPDGRLYKHIGFDPNFKMEPIFCSEPLMDFTNWGDLDWLMPIRDRLFSQPFIILPGIGKPFDIRKLACLWDRPSGFFYTARDVYLIGLSLSEDDFFIRFMFLESLPISDWKGKERLTTIINPSASDLQNYTFIPDNRKQVRQNNFSMPDIEYMRANLRS